ncbi:hypothetical protein O159_21130 [Leifsonia xyli subsp. cynodontis DSM 46306]|jgi:hypothetical protein|uniref:MFS transporter n=1 Tax=Leifsonia xyli subsp. cynodontis DSM 46306 TaxID=1389489 RepID=U3P730_LEIXC|nr:hypothetical protein [Leifsonia xyli]AGW42095.1 hypothetical protein O159_21130 [Leifsonia xyli subsp. cynodontis DSM 46306]
MSSPAPTGFIDAQAAAGTETMNPRARRFLARLTGVTAGGMFIDGYVFAVIGVTIALRTFQAELGVDAFWLGI